MIQTIDNLVQEILTQAQRYAHAWTVIGTPVDTGDASKRATAEKAELERLVRTSLANLASIQIPTEGRCPEQCPKYPFCACMVEG